MMTEIKQLSVRALAYRSREDIEFWNYLERVRKGCLRVFAKDNQNYLEELKDASMGIVLYILTKKDSDFFMNYAEHVTIEQFFKRCLKNKGNTIYKEGYSQARNTGVEEIEGIIPSKDDFQFNLDKERRMEIIRTEILHLGENCARILTYSLLEEKTPLEIAEITNKLRATVEAARSKCIQKLKEKLSKYGPLFSSN